MWDVDETGLAHSQQNSYQNFMKPNGDKHETGVVSVLDDEQVSKILAACYNHKVIPFMLVLNHAEDHSMESSTGDNSRTGTLPGTDMKARLDSVHQQVDLPTLNASHYDSGKCTAEEGPILEELDVDVYASGSWDTGRRDTSRTVRRWGVVTNLRYSLWGTQNCRFGPGIIF